MPSPTAFTMGEDRHHWVDLGPIPGLPSWHEQNGHSSVPFPTREAADLFASRHQELQPLRDIKVR